MTREYSGNIRVQGRGWVPWAADPLRLLWAAVPPRTFGDILVPRTLGLLPLLKGPSQPTCQLEWLAVNMAAGGCGSGWVNISHYLILASCLHRATSGRDISPAEPGPLEEQPGSQPKASCRLSRTLGRGLPGKRQPHWCLTTWVPEAHPRGPWR